MTVTYTKTVGVSAFHQWSDGLAATTCATNTGLGLPHDLRHWLIEAQVDLPFGFWSLAGQQAPFASFTVVRGRWPRGRTEWLDRLRQKHELSMLHAEAVGGYWLADPDLDVHAQWHEIRQRLAQNYAFSDSPLEKFGPDDVERLRPFARRAVETWNQLPGGGRVQVRWPGANDLIVLPADASVELPSLLFNDRVLRR